MELEEAALILKIERDRGCLSILSVAGLESESLMASLAPYRADRTASN